MSTLRGRVSVVVLTHNRVHELLRTLGELRQLAERPPICVVDNASSDGSAAFVAATFPGVRVVRLDRNLGAAGRNAGVRSVDTPYVAFCDDDTWWASGSLTRAADVLDAYPRLAAVTARVLVGPSQVEDPVSRMMAASPLQNDLGVPGCAILGMLAGACMIRRCAFLAAGGYHPRFFLGNEEALLAIDLAAAEGRMAYLPDIAVHHHPSRIRDSGARRQLLLRNALWCVWLRRPLMSALQETLRLLRPAIREPRLLRAVAAAALGAPWILRERRIVPAQVEDALQKISAAYADRKAAARRRAILAERQ